MLAPTAADAPILVGIDHSAAAMEALDFATEMARRTGRPLELVHVMTDDGDRAREASELEELIWERGLDASAVVLERGSVADGLLDRARRTEAAVLAVGHDGAATDLGRLLLGSVADAVVRNAEIDVLVTRSAAWHHGRIAVATDFSPLSDAALEAALELTQPDTRVDLIHCFDVPALPLAAALAPRPDQLKELAAERGNQILDRWRPRHTSIHLQLVDESPHRGLLSWLETEPCDLMVLGSHGHRGLDRIVVGSVAEDMVRHAPCSVMVVKTTEDRAPTFDDAALTR